jgi:hypothetical protein
MRPTKAFLQEAEALHSEGLRRCITCDVVKSESLFPVQTRARYGLAGKCKDCINEQNRSYYHKYKDPEKERKKSREQYLRMTPRERHIAKWKSTLKVKYGLTLGDWHAMLIDQSGRCEICGDPMIGSRNLCVDHCHRTGRVRSLLCTPCNAGLGAFKDDPARLAAAIDYLPAC